MDYKAKIVKNGNIKIGASMWTFNKLAGNGTIAGCKGTCGKYCRGCYNEENPKKSSCYVFKAYVQYAWDKSSVVKGHINNTMAMRLDMDKAFNDIQKQLSHARQLPTAMRIHSSGELESAQELEKWMETASMFKNIPFYIYTKVYDILEEVLQKKNNETIPNNFFINVSIWHNNGVETYNKWKHLNCVRAFVYDDGELNESLKINCYCPAYDENGKLSHELTCDKCKICFQAKAKVCGCHAH